MARRAEARRSDRCRRRCRPRSGRSASSSARRSARTGAQFWQGAARSAFRRRCANALVWRRSARRRAAGARCRSRRSLVSLELRGCRRRSSSAHAAPRGGTRSSRTSSRCSSSCRSAPRRDLHPPGPRSGSRSFGLAVPAALVEGLGVRAALARGLAARASGLRPRPRRPRDARARRRHLAVHASYFVLREYADNTRLIAAALAALVVSPLVFLGSALLYVDQEARLRSRERATKGVRCRPT